MVRKRKSGDGSVTDVDELELPTGARLWANVIKPALEGGKTAVQIAEEYGVPVAHIEEVVQDFGGDGPRLFRDIVAWLDLYFKFVDPFHSRLCALFIIQSWIAHPILSTVFYLGISGPMSSGKTTLLEILRDLCWEGVMSGDATAKALTRLLHKGITMFADEADKMDEEQRDLIQGSARRGYRRGSTRILNVSTGKDWEPITINIFGCYAFSFYSPVDVDPALLSRMVTFEVSKLPTDQVKERIFHNMRRVLNGPSDLRKRIRIFVEDRLKEWSIQRVDETLADPRFHERVQEVVGTRNMSRDWEIVSTMLLVSDFLGVDLIEEIRSAFGTEARAAVEDGDLEALEDLRDIFLGTAKGTRTDDGIRMRFEDVRYEWNLKRRQSGDKPMDAKAFKPYLAGLGLRPGYEMVHPKNRSWIVWTPHLDEKLAGETSPATNPDLTRYLGSPNPSFETSPDGLTSPNRVTTQVERVTAILIKGLGKGDTEGHIPREGLTLDEIWNRLKDVEGMTRDALESTLKHLLDRGEAYSPKEGRFKAT